jgi:hypothetical protein
MKLQRTVGQFCQEFTPTLLKPAQITSTSIPSERACRLRHKAVFAAVRLMTTKARS